MVKWELWTSEGNARKYLAVEYGEARVDYHLSRLGRDHRGWVAMHDDTVYLSGARAWTKGRLQQLAAHIGSCIAFYEGKNGLPMTAGGGLLSVLRVEV